MQSSGEGCHGGITSQQPADKGTARSFDSPPVVCLHSMACQAPCPDSR